MRYVIVCIAEGIAGSVNNELRRTLLEEMNIKSSKLPAHFTIKAPFEYGEEIEELERTLEAFCSKEKACPFTLQGYDHFDDRVIYMKVNMSEEGKVMHDRLIEEMDKISYINFNQQDGKDKVFHVTVSSKKLAPVYEEVWRYVQNIPCEFKCSFNNISIYRWQENTWKLYKAYRLKE